MLQLESNVSLMDAERGWQGLSDNSYPGRVAILGVNTEGDRALQAYGLSGRSLTSRNRIFVQSGSSVWATTPDMSTFGASLARPGSLFYYRAMSNRGGVHVVSNGAQTDPAMDGLRDGLSLDAAVRNAPTEAGVDLSCYEPDGPTFTPRITGAIDLREGALSPLSLHIVRKSMGSDEPVYTAYGLPSIGKLAPGTGYGLRTYNDDGNPPPSYDQDPFVFPLGTDMRDTAGILWDALEGDNRVAVAVRAIDLETGQPAGTCIINSQV